MEPKEADSGDLLVLLAQAHPHCKWPTDGLKVCSQPTTLAYRLLIFFGTNLFFACLGKRRIRTCMCFPVHFLGAEAANVSIYNSSG